MYDMDLLNHTDTVNEQLARYGVKFGIYIRTIHLKNNYFHLMRFRGLLTKMNLTIWNVA